MTDQYRVMVVDDSAVIRGLMARFLEADPEIAVVASVSNGQMAIDRRQDGDRGSADQRQCDPQDR